MSRRKGSTSGLTFSEYLTRRQDAILAGKVLNTETGQFVPVSEARASTLLEITMRRGFHQRRLYKDQIRDTAASMAKADRMDPFMYDRICSHLRSGVADRSDYGCEWRREIHDLFNADGTTRCTAVIDVPTNIHRM